MSKWVESILMFLSVSLIIIGGFGLIVLIVLFAFMGFVMGSLVYLS